ncbi:MAG: NADH-quinone oxidoreductase subunit L [Candidatus Caldarchaeales archaeon]|jgi:NADH-quinone oxidoreductase subunit M
MIELGIPSLLLTVVLPVGLAPIAFLYGRVAGHRASELISHTTLGVVLALTALNALRVASGHVIEETYPWLPQLGLSIGLKLDGLSLLFLALISLVGFLASVYSSRYMEGERGLEAYYALLMLFVGGMLGVVLVTNLFLFYVFWELMLIPSYFLIAYWGTGNARVIGFKYFAMTHAGALALLTGIVWLNVLYGNVEFSTLLARAPTDTRPELQVISLLIFAGAAVKMALFPVHTWLPDAHAEAPTPISVLLSGVMIKTGVYAFARIVIEFLGPHFKPFAGAIALLSVITMVWGGAMALVQTDIKRVLAYSSVSQIGYISFGLSLLAPVGVMGGLLQVFTHGLAKSLLFMTAGVIIHSVGERDIRKLGGLMSVMPFTAVAFLAGGLSIAGTPPLAGFFSELVIFLGGFQAGLWLLTFVAILATAITLGYYTRTFMYVFQVGEHRHAHDAPVTMAAPMVVLLTLLVTFGIYVGEVQRVLVVSWGLR